ncbi:hypothetical protein JVT61DRAFT_13323 [Boletus reticuloceps]|uniref:Uncharacterized protein n=1 Tax=Boletus reticuloceps TaxID=495285 RepID=A0A8I3A2V7_9AGAM|nr:hypothetical protein JVT61DRAFT_13323 [Boletus reticuloceps]
MSDMGTISKGLQCRSEAIRKAIIRYNIQASKLVPSCPTISWKDIVKYTSLAEFDLLCSAGDDVHECVWARPAIREAMGKVFKLCRAKEEITRLGIKIQCLQTTIHDKEVEITQTITDLHQSLPELAFELQHRY